MGQHPLFPRPPESCSSVCSEENKPTLHPSGGLKELPPTISTAFDLYREPKDQRMVILILKQESEAPKGPSDFPD